MMKREGGCPIAEDRHHPSEIRGLREMPELQIIQGLRDETGIHRWCRIGLTRIW